MTEREMERALSVESRVSLQIRLLYTLLAGAISLGFLAAGAYFDLKSRLDRQHDSQHRQSEIQKMQQEQITALVADTFRREDVASLSEAIADSVAESVAKAILEYNR
ncbi:MAG: hypothetical protein MJH10_21145 [Epibacterium sp.]|nr:hypothetical protein [Epibacterium sp.]NQX75962.1 hypothetical protein [Epibacterium sp.]